MAFQTAVQALFGASGQDLDQCAVDWSRNRVFTSGANSTSRIGLVSGALEATASNNAYGPNTSPGSPVGLDAAGNIYKASPSGFNFGGVAQISGNTLALIEQWGASATFSNLPDGIPFTGGFANVPVGNVQFMIARAEGGNSAFLDQCSVLNGPVFAGRIFTFGGFASHVCGGPPDSRLAYLMSGPEATVDLQELHFYSIFCSSVGTWNPSDWPTQNGALIVNEITQIHPTDIDLSWTTIRTDGICIDQTDGNVIASVSNFGATDYVIKVNSTTGQILWKCPTLATGGGSMMAFSSITHQRFGVISSHDFQLIDTGDGSSTHSTAGLSGLGVGNGAYSDTLGAMVCSGSYFNSGPDSPLQLNATPGLFTSWMALYLAERFPTPFIPGGRHAYTRIWGNYP